MPRTFHSPKCRCCGHNPSKGMSSKSLRARWILPVVGDPIENGEVIIEGDVVSEVRAFSGNPSKSTDYGNAIIMPGFVNVHTHLEYTVMRGLIEDIDFFSWIRELTMRKAALSLDDWNASATLGALEAIAGGVTCIGDCTDSGAALYGAIQTGLRGVIYQELFGIDGKYTTAEIMHDLQTKLEKLLTLAKDHPLEIGISPHSPYTLSAELLSALGELHQNSDYKFCIHAAESQAEAQLLRIGTGPIADMYARRNIHWCSPGCSTVEYLHRFGLLSQRTMLVHGTQIGASDCDIVRDTHTAWAHCPKSNAKLGNGVAAIELLEEHGYPVFGSRIGLGSDSVVSNNNMDMFEEMRFAVLLQRAHHRDYSQMTAKSAVEMATIQGARALNMELEIGSLEVGKKADIAVVNLNSWNTIPAYDPYNALVFSCNSRDVAATYINGKLVYHDGKPLNLQVEPVLSQFGIAVQKMRDWKVNLVV